MWYNSQMAHKLVSDRCTLTMGARGRFVLPAAVRKRLSLKEGDRMVLIVEDGGRLVLVPIAEAVRRARGMFKDLVRGRSLVDELIADRRAEAAKEDRE